MFKERDKVGSKCSRREMRLVVSVQVFKTRDEVGSKCSRQEMRLVVSVQHKR